MGTDICMILTGGDRPHLGAVAVAQPRASLADPLIISATTSIITLPGHKEDVLARGAAARVAAASRANVTVCCGIHVDNILPDEIAGIETMCNDIIDEVIVYINSARYTGADGVEGI